MDIQLNEIEAIKEILRFCKPGWLLEEKNDNEEIRVFFRKTDDSQYLNCFVAHLRHDEGLHKVAAYFEILEQMIALLEVEDVVEMKYRNNKMEAL